ncbi:MAG: class I SAM-dependent methyltransferase [Dehalococcoidia bacterium]|nr:MAG: class I SAM-dependent methyltransferase [Dehalococcoidia bacterium]
MKIERLAYLFLGNNVIIGLHIRKQLKFLKEIVPPHFQKRQMDDLGCGDGKVTVLLKEIFLPTRLRGYDINPSLVRRAKNRGVEAEVKNLDEDVPSGELAILWGVLHHLQDREGCLKRVKANYPLIFIREPIKGNIDLLELGSRLKREEMERLIKKHLANPQIFYCGNSIFVFYVSPTA